MNAERVSVATTEELVAAIARAYQAGTPKTIVLEPGVYDASRFVWPTAASGITIVGTTASGPPITGSYRESLLSAGDVRKSENAVAELALLAVEVRRLRAHRR